MKFFLCFALIIAGVKGPCQNKASVDKIIKVKPSLDTSAFSNWQTVGSPLLSNNGNFASYSINNLPKGQQTLVIRDIISGKDIQIVNARQAGFTNDSRQLIFLKKDSLGILSLDNGMILYRPKILSYRLFMHGNQEFLAWESADARLILMNLATTQTQEFDHIKSYSVSKDGKILLLKVEDKVNDAYYKTLRWVNLSSFDSFPVWYTSNENEDIVTDKTVFSPQNDKVAFIKREQVKGQVSYSLWYFECHQKNTFLLVDEALSGLDNGLRLSASLLRFSFDGRRIFFNAKESEQTPKPDPKTVKMDVWSYTDTILQSQQLKEVESKAPFRSLGISSQDYAMAIDLADKKIVRLQEKDEQLLFFTGKSDNIAFAKRQIDNNGEQNWNAALLPTSSLVFTETGERRKLNFINLAGREIALSPNAKYLIYADQFNRNFYSYSIASGRSINITANLPIPLVDENADENPQPKSRGISLFAWKSDASAIIVNDRYDLWAVDISGLKSPICLTGGFGRQNRISFRLCEQRRYSLETISDSTVLLLAAFDEKNKNNGFYSIKFGQSGAPTLLFSGPYFFTMPSLIGGLPEFAPVKAKYANIWLVSRQSAGATPNYFVTKDFKTFLPISEVYPERRYNWLTSELINFTSLNGGLLKGVLYKPENFDPQKKYPVIIHYYESLSHELNIYLRPEAISNNLNIPWFVSNGYLVFTPDIHYVMGKPGLSAFNAIMGAEKILGRLPYVNPKKIGLQGHSWGGYETNYIVSHTAKFAAVMSSSSVSDFMRGYGSIMSDGKSKQFFYEVHQSRMGFLPWERPDLYILNSPIHYAHNVSSPLLIMNNKLDGAVGFEQGLGWFLALRRLGKRAWMLQYDNEAHSLANNEAQLLHTIRMTQFFDHYLKDSAAPKWMMYGVPARLKGIDYGLELVKEKDMHGKWVTPREDGLLTEQEKNRIHHLKRVGPLEGEFR